MSEKTEQPGHIFQVMGAVVDVKFDSLDDLPDDAAEFAAEFAARGGDREPRETPRKGFLRRKDRKETEK